MCNNPWKNKRIKQGLLFLLLSVAITFPLLFKMGASQQEWYKNHENAEYLLRADITKHAIKENVIKQEWSHLTQKTSGDHFFLFYPPITYTAIAILGLATSLALAGKIYIGVMAILGAFGIALVLHFMLPKKYNDLKYIGALLYSYAPYKIFNTYTRGDLAEVTAWTLLLFGITGILLIAQQHYKKGWLLTVIVTALLVHTHLLGSIVSLLYMGIVMVLLLWTTKEKLKALLYASIAVLSGLSLSAWVWLPIILRKNSTQAKVMLKIWHYTGNYYRVGIFETGIDSFTTEIYLLIAGILTLTTITIWQNKKKEKEEGTRQQQYFIIALVLFFIFYSLTQPRFEWLIAIIPFFDHIQFPFRFMGPAEISLILLIFTSIPLLKNKRITLIIVLLSTTLILNRHITLFNASTTNPVIETYVTKNKLESSLSETLTKDHSIETLAKALCKKELPTAIADEYAPKKNYLRFETPTRDKDCSSLIGIYIAPQDREKIESVDITTQTITVTLKKDKEDSITLLQRNNTQWETTSGIREEELGYLVINNITEKTFTLSQRPLRSVLLGKIISGATLLTLLGLLTYFIIKKQNNGKERTA